MRLFLAALCLALSASLPALKPEKAPANMETVREAWTLLEWKDAKQARRWFRTATKSKEAVVAYYGWEGIADSDAQLGLSPAKVTAAYVKARKFAQDKVLDAPIQKRANEKLVAYQKAVVEAAAPGKKWPGREGRRALEVIGEGGLGADKDLRLAAYETLGDRALHRSRSATAAGNAISAWLLALNQGPDKLDRERLERKLRRAQALLPGVQDESEDGDGDAAGLVADPAVLALMGRCAQCAGQGSSQRRACAEVAQAYTQFYGPGQRRPREALVRQRVRQLQAKLAEAGCL